MAESNLHGKNWVGAKLSALGEARISGFNPRLGVKLDPPFFEATPEECDAAMELAVKASVGFRERQPEDVASFLERIAAELRTVSEPLIARAVAETGLPPERITGELGRTTGQIQLFANLVREGSWVDARIDRADPERKPLPKPDVRRMLIPLGPVIVFGASNFPLAFSVAGGDTISALAGRNPVVCKAHPAHPGTSEIVAGAIRNAVEGCGLPEGVFSMVHGASPEVSLRLVRHPSARAVGFTGSLKAGRALFDAAAQRPNPIPVYAEMGSVNPVFVLPGALAERAASIAQGLRQSVTLGVGQFCTSPGLVVGVGGAAFDQLSSGLRAEFARAPAGTMLHPGILGSYASGVEKLKAIGGTRSTPSDLPANPQHTEARPELFESTAQRLLAEEDLGREVFGPSTVLIQCESPKEMEQVARRMEGSLTATVHGTPEDLRTYRGVIRLLEEKAGRILINGYPTGVEVCAAMHHGGPYPATSDSKFTSVGTAAILRFARPVCYQNFPQELLPAELRDENDRKIWRLVDGKFSLSPINPKV